MAGAFLLSLLATEVPLQAQYQGALPVPDPYREGFASINQDDAKEWVSLLAGPGFEGRGSGQAGYVRAAHWIAGKLAEYGLEPMGDGGTYFQMLPMERIAVDRGQSKITGPGELVIPFDRNVELDRFANQAEFAGKITFVRLAGEASKLESGDVQDRVVIYSTDAQNESKVDAIIGSQRPAIMLRIVDTISDSTTQLKRPRRGFSANSGKINSSAARLIANASQGSLDWLFSEDGNEKKVFRSESELKVQVRIREEPFGVPNVLAWYPGSDPAVRNEYIVIGAHLDHLGMQGEKMYPGADDNASGSTALLSIARAIALNPVKPKRSILFTWFAAEETGLLGSKHYCENPVLPIDKMSCMLNLDMVGRNEEKEGEPGSENIRSLHLVGTQKGDKRLHDVVLDANRYVNFDFEYDEEGVFTRSDQANFFKKGVSVAFLFGGFHPDYHKSTDHPDLINCEKLVSAARLFYLVAYMAAEQEPFRVPSEDKPSEDKPPTPVVPVSGD